MTLTEKFLFLVGIGILLFGFIVGSGGMMMLFAPEEERGTLELVLLIAMFGGLPIAAGIILCKRMLNRGKARREELQERALLELARRHQGRLTIADVAANMAITATQAKALLDQCHLNNLAQLEASESGVLIYQFAMNLSPAGEPRQDG